MPVIKKKGCKWLFVSHEEVSVDDIKNALKEIPNEPIWLAIEPVILHVCCRTLDKALGLLSKARDIGFKRSGLQSMHPKIMLELISTENLCTVLSYNGKMLVSDEYLNSIVLESNKKLRKTKEKIKAFEGIIQQST